MKEYLWNRTGSLCLFCAQMHDVFMFMYLSQYRTTEMPSFKYYVSCATFIFLCIFIIQMCVTQQWVMETHTHTHTRTELNIWSYNYDIYDANHSASLLFSFRPKKLGLVFALLACVLLLTLAICFAGHIQVINGWHLPVLNTLMMVCVCACISRFGGFIDASTFRLCVTWGMSWDLFFLVFDWLETVSGMTDH